MAKKFKWKQIVSRIVVSIKGDVLTLYDSNPQEVFEGRGDGYIISEGRLHIVGYLLDDYCKADNPRVWRKVASADPSIPNRLVMNEGFSKPLPLP